MGMMTRRNIKQRAVGETASVFTESEKNNFSKHTNPLVEDTEANYTKTDINRMSTTELKELAKSKGIDNSDNMTGSELKKVLIELFNL